MATVMITGGTGLVGRRLAALLLEKGYEVIVLTRSKPVNDAPVPSGKKGLSHAGWNPEKQQINQDALSRTDYIIHLAGAGVADKRWSVTRKQEILNSRTESSSLLVKALSETQNKVSAVISSSAIGWYGEDTENSRQQGFSEESQADTAYLGETCRLWETSIEPVSALGKRLVKFRIGIVMSNDGGALAEFKKPLKAGIAGILGSGKQMISWIHIDDLCRMFIYAIENPALNGTYNAVAPNPVSNAHLTLALAKQMRGKWFVPIYVPAILLKIIMGEMSIEVLKSATVSAQKIQQTGFAFSFPTIEEALASINTK